PVGRGPPAAVIHQPRPGRQCGARVHRAHHVRSRDGAARGRPRHRAAGRVRALRCPHGLAGEPPSRAVRPLVPRTRARGALRPRLTGRAAAGAPAAGTDPVNGRHSAAGIAARRAPGLWSVPDDGRRADAGGGGPMDVAFTEEIASLKLGAGEVFHGEGILAVTKALLQSGVSYVGGYQGAPVSHLLDVMVQARDYLDTLGVHVEACTNEASAAAMLGASINYPVRGAVTWKSIVGTYVAADALSNLASPGVVGGPPIMVGEDYGEGATVIQERTHAYAMKSSMWLFDPRPDLPTIVRMTEEAFALSEASNTPVFMELRIRACHVRGSFTASDNRAPAISTRTPVDMPAVFDYARLAHPPVTFAHEQLKGEVRLPTARAAILA